MGTRFDNAKENYEKKKPFKIDRLNSGADKHLESKLRTDLVAPEMIEGLARVLTYGAQKYEDRNWEKGIPYTISYASALRHLLQWCKGVDIDEESGLRHIEQAFVNLGMIVTQTSRNRIDLDDRELKYEK